MATQYYEGVGRRKTSSARVRITPGHGNIIINDKPSEEYFPRVGDIEKVLAPLRAAEMEGRFDITVKVSGGGVTGQAGAVCQGLARALVKMDPDLRSLFREGRLLTRDARMKERKKPGLKRARKAPTYTKR
ncbi:MAG TPA: 30S ribosomal protein S9 [Anaerolineae bacterium]|nr:30S ribosomal protein S9 [Anaerolineae bacterium]